MENNYCMYEYLEGKKFDSCEGCYLDNYGYAFCQFSKQNVNRLYEKVKKDISNLTKIQKKIEKKS